MPFLHERLPNGLDVVAETSEAAVSTSVGFFVATGARDEARGIEGVSHFLEHMAFKGPVGLSAEEINRRFDRLGAAVNAFTSEEDTVYHAAVLPKYQHAAVELLAGLLRPELRAADFATEKQVILEEIRMYDDQPPFGADDRCRAAFFGSHPLAASVLGTVESVGGLEADAMRDYHRRRYAPDRIVLAASGAVDFPALVEQAKRLCGAWEPSAAGERAVPGRPRAAASPGVERIARPAATLGYAVRMAAGPAETDPDAERWAAALLAVVLGDSSGSRLYWSLVDPGLAEHAALGHHDFLDAGLLITQLSCEPEEVDELLERILEVYAEATRDGITAKEFEQARNKVAGRVVLAGERPRRRLFDVGLEWSHRRRYRPIAQSLADLDAITLDDVHRILAAWPLDAPAATVIAGPEG
ncbi:MAG: insulinase family protein [Planctomycetia bacterium]|nr:insulinase family protein [Planctomycetia bacterium]